MAYRLKLYLDTSIDVKEETSTVFTSSMLKYEPSGGRKLALESYPMFTPYVTYPKERILNMKYYQRVELFFNKSKFKRIIMSTWNGRKDTNKEQQKRREENNLDVFIKAIMPTAYPVVNNYNKSYEYFEGNKLFDITTKGIGQGLPFLPGRFRKEFSHLIIGNSTYTITGVTLKNDIFNHPIYSKLIREFANIESTDIDVNIKKDENDFYEKEFFKKFENSEGSENTLWENLDLNDQSIDEFVTRLGNRVVDEKYQMIQIFYKTLQDIKNSRFNYESYKGDWKNRSIEIENKLNVLYENRASIELLIQINGINYNQQNQLRAVLKEFGKIWIKKKALDYMEKKEFDFSSEGSREQDIREYIEKIKQSFKQFSDMLMNLSKDRFIQNEVMRETIQKRKTNNFKDLLLCREDKSSCQTVIDKDLLYVGLDRTKGESNNNFTTVEIYLMVNVIEGDMNTQNYKKIKCKYLDKSLGSIFESFFYPAKTWDISTRKVFFSVKDELKKVDEMNKRKTKKKKSSNGVKVKSNKNKTRKK